MAAYVRGAKEAFNVGEALILAIGVGVVAYETFQLVYKAKQLGAKVEAVVDEISGAGQWVEDTLNEEWAVISGAPGAPTGHMLLERAAAGDNRAVVELMNPLIGIPAASSELSNDLAQWWNSL